MDIQKFGRKLGQIVLWLVVSLIIPRLIVTLALPMIMPYSEMRFFYVNVDWISGSVFAIGLFYLMRSHLVLALQVGALAIVSPISATMFYLITIYFRNTMISLNVKLIGKYALLLALFFAFERAFDHLLFYLTPSSLFDTTEFHAVLYKMLPSILWLSLNIVTACLIHYDRIRLNVETKFVYLATILYRPIGVVAFLLYSVKTTNEIVVEGNDDILDLPLTRNRN